MEFAFIAGNLALDFVATVASRDTIAEEKLPSASALAEWLVLGRALSAPPDVSPDDFDHAIGLREATYAALRDRAAGRQIQAPTLALINAAAAHPTPVPELSSGGLVSHGSVDAALALVARAAQTALIDPRMRFCAGVDCTRPFIDASRGGTRRWCGMSGCGDRAKAAAYRRRMGSKSSESQRRGS
ncbi:MAG TPA: CGNR zinc finger domain-containing protein [Microbacterium sp.]|nr:CGNR zinc finger domain-containing protein [Microbacterium sp.]